MKIDKNGKLFGRINIIDLLVLLAVAAAVVGIGARYATSAAKNAKEKTEFTYIVEIDGIRSYSLEALEKKGMVVDTRENKVIGEIIDVTARPQKIQALKSDGTPVLAEVPERYTASVTVKTEGKESERGYFVGSDTELSVGGYMSVVTKYANSFGRVKSIEKLD